MDKHNEGTSAIYGNLNFSIIMAFPLIACKFLNKATFFQQLNIKSSNIFIYYVILTLYLQLNSYTKYIHIISSLSPTCYACRLMDTFVL